MLITSNNLVRKSSFLSLNKFGKPDIAIVCILIMLAGFLFSRAMLSMGMILFGINALWNLPPRKWPHNTWWLVGVVWVAMYGITWFWSRDKATWNVMFQMKLPILLLPLSFASLPAFSSRQLQVITMGMAAMLVGGSCYSLFFLIAHYQYYLFGYQYSHIIPTPVYGDYICFSSAIALFIAWSFYFWPKLTTSAVKWFIGASVAFLIIYLHILAAKSGLVCLYLFLFGWGIYTSIARKKVIGILFVISLPLLLSVAIRVVPTLRERTTFIIYTWYVARAGGGKTGSLGDVSRLISYDIAIKLIRQHPITGVGAGDVLDEMKKGYAQWYPEVKEESNKLIPHNQFLTVALGCGVPAMAVFAIWVFLPLGRMGRNRESFFFFMAWFLLLVELMIEPFLEGQFGTFVYLFFLLLFASVLPRRGKLRPVQPPTLSPVS